MTEQHMLLQNAVPEPSCGLEAYPIEITIDTLTIYSSRALWPALRAILARLNPRILEVKHVKIVLPDSWVSLPVEAWD
jgi:hypothetical protein